MKNGTSPIPRRTLKRRGEIVMKDIKNLLVNCFLLMLAILLFFLLAEGITRLVMPNSVKIRLMHQLDEKLGYRLVPNYAINYQTFDFTSSIKINSEGLRDREYPKTKDPKTFRILVLGDSFTLGLGVNIEESYPKVLETMLNQSSKGSGARTYEVINAGVDGYGTEQEYLYLQELLQRYEPDLVIVGFYSNDVVDVMNGIPAAITKQKLKNRFYFLSYLRGIQILLQTATVMKKNFSTSIGGVFAPYQENYSPQFKKAFDRTEGYLVKIRDISRSRGAKTIIVIIPLCFEIDRGEWKKKALGHLYTDDFFNKNMTKLSDTITEFGKLENIPTLPLLPVFRTSKVRPVYFARDSHWTRDGHRIAAESIFKYLQKGIL